MLLRTLVALPRAVLASALVMSALTLGAAPLAHATPQLYVYEGGGCKGLAGLPQFEAFLGRKVDGVDDFDDDSSTWANAVSMAKWGLSCWKGQVPNIALALPLAVKNYTPTKGSTQLADVGAGKLDSYFQQIGAALVANGFPNAQIRPGWEENGNWYPWRAYPSEADFRAAFAHVYKVLKAVPGAHFTVWFNPTTGYMASQQNVDFPGPGNEDGIAWDIYANIYASLGKTTEPTLWNDQYAGSWGVDTLGNWHKELPTAVPEFGVGKSATAPVGAPSGFSINGATPPVISGTQVANGGDDPYFMREALAYFTKVGVKFVGYWDYYDGSGSLSKISDGSRPHEALEFVNVFGSPAMKAIFNAKAAPFTTTPAPALKVTNCHAVAFQNGPGHFLLVVWATDPHPSATVAWSGATTAAHRYNPAGANPTAAVEEIGAANSWTGALKPNHPIVIDVQQ